MEAWRGVLCPRRGAGFRGNVFCGTSTEMESVVYQRRFGMVPVQCKVVVEEVVCKGGVRGGACSKQGVGGESVICKGGGFKVVKVKRNPVLEGVV